MQIPQIGFGSFRNKDRDVLRTALLCAIEECGVRHIDTAYVYENQDIIGDVLQEIFAKGKIKREDMFITSKLWCTHHRPDLVEKEIRWTLADLKLDYLDLWLMHFPVAFKSTEEKDFWPKGENGKVIYEAIDILDTYKAMEKVQKEGLTRYIGVSNFSIEQLERIKFNCEIMPYAIQVECHVYKQQRPLLKYCEQNNIYLMAHTTIASPPLKGYRGVPLIEDPDVVDIAAKHNKSPAQVAIRFLVQLSPKMIVIPGSKNPKNIKLNADLNFELTNEEMERLKSLDRYFNMKYYPEMFNVDPLMIGFNTWL